MKGRPAVARTLRGDSARHAGAADVEPWILAITSFHSRRVPHELRADGPVRGNVWAAVHPVECSCRNARETIWREDVLAARTDHRGCRPSGFELAPGFAAAFGARALWLSGYRFSFVSVMVAVALTCPPAVQGASMGILGAISAFASVIGAPLGGVIGRDFGWRNGILAYAGSCARGSPAICRFLSP